MTCHVWKLFLFKPFCKEYHSLIICQTTFWLLQWLTYTCGLWGCCLYATSSQSLLLYFISEAQCENAFSALELMTMIRILILGLTSWVSTNNRGSTTVETACRLFSQKHLSTTILSDLQNNTWLWHKSGRLNHERQVVDLFQG